MIFPIGTKIEYKGMIGTVAFTTDTQMSVTVRSFDERVREVRIIIHRSEYENVSLITGNHQRD